MLLNSGNRWCPFVQLQMELLAPVSASLCEKDVDKATGAFSKWTRSLASRISDEVEGNEELVAPQVSHGQEGRHLRAYSHTEPILMLSLLREKRV